MKNEMNKRKIDQGFIDDLRKHQTIVNCIFEDGYEDTEIVPKNFTHGQLRNNNPIDESIERFYFLPTSNMLTDDEFQEITKDRWRHVDRSIYLNPYSLIVYGAYFPRKDLVIKLSMLKYGGFKEYIEKEHKLEYFEDLIPYFKEYAEGFKKGYEGFENNCITPYLLPLSDKHDHTNKVFEFLTKKIIFNHDWSNNHRGFTVAQDESDPVEGGKIINAFDDGQKQGYFYRAWSIVFSMNHLFAPLFQEHLKNKQSQQFDTTSNTNKSKLKLREVALMFAYKDERITNENKDEIANRYGYNSGHKLLIHFNKYQKAANRKGDEGTKQKNKNKIKNIENIIYFLDDEDREKATSELSILKGINETYS